MKGGGRGRVAVVGNRAKEEAEERRERERSRGPSVSIGRLR